VRPLARLHALTDASILQRPDLGARAAAIAAAGPCVALHARDRTATARTLSDLTRRFSALAAPPTASVVVSARADIAAAWHTQGVQLGDDDLVPADARRVFVRGWIGRSVHSASEARRARDEGANYVVLGNIFETATHPGRPGLGIDALRMAVATGIPVIAVGGMTPARAHEACEAGAWGIAAISALWMSPDPYATARAMLAPWMDQ
jgi:thiamine-phosphate diphosphorylase